MTSPADRHVSAELFQRGKQVLPGAVNSPVRAFKSVGGVPPFLARGQGARVTDVDGHSYIDYVMSYGPLLLGHAPLEVTEAICAAVENGTSFGGPTQAEVELAELVCQMVPSVEMVRFVNSGSEATTSALRLARGATGRNKVVKCAGCFHGSVDSLLVSAGSGPATLGLPGTAGVPESFAAETIVVEYNSIADLEQTFERFGSEIAAFIVEPVAANMGVVLPARGFLEAARRLTQEHGALLIFDEVISGFRLGPAGAQGHFGVMPDLSCFGKIIGGGVPCGAYGGRRDLMEQLAPLGPVYQAGTLSGNPVATAAGLAMLRKLQAEGPALYTRLQQKTEALAQGITQAFADAAVPVVVQTIGSLLTPFFTGQPVRSYADAEKADTAAFSRFFHNLLDAGIYVAPSQFEAWFLSAAHTDDDIQATVEAVNRALTAK